MKSLIAPILGTAIAFSSLSAAHADDAVQIHGFASQAFMYATKNKYMAPDSKDGSFDYNEFGVNVGKNVTDDLHVGLQLFARDLGDFGNDAVTLDWAYGDYRWRPWLGIRAGKIKLPIGLYNETRDLDAARTGVFLPQSVYNEAFRETIVAIQGAALYGRVPLGRLGALPYNLLAGSFSFPANGATQAVINNSIGPTMSLKPTSNAPTLVGYVEWETPLDGLRFAFSEFYTHWDQRGTTTGVGSPMPAGLNVKADIDSLHIETYSAEFIWRNLTMAAEYTRRRATTAVGIDLAGTGTFTPVPLPNNGEDAFYVSAAYRLASWLEVGSYYAAQYADAHSHSTATVNAYNKDIDLSLRFDLAGSWILKTEAHKMYGAKNVLYDVAHTERDWWFFASKVSYTF